MSITTPIEIIDPPELWVASDRCPCGWRGGYREQTLRTRHAKEHLDWALGISVSDSGPVAVVTGASWPSERKAAYRLAVLFQHERGYDFPLLPHPTVWKNYRQQPRAYLAVQNGLAIALAIVGETARWGWDAPDPEGYVHFNQRGPCLAIVGIFVCGNYRRRGVARRLVETVAEMEGVPAVDLAWLAPLSTAGLRLAERFAGEKLRLCGHVDWK